MTTILIAEDHGLVRNGITVLLAKDCTLKVIGEASDGFQVVEQVETLKPNILLLDLAMPKLHGLEILRRLSPSGTTKVIIVTMHTEEPYIFEAFRCGALGYVSKDSGPEELIQAIQSVVVGNRYLSQDLRKRNLNFGPKSSKKSIDPYDNLTMREHAVLRFAAQGKTSKEIGTELYISPRTAETHRANLMRKLHLKTQTDLVRLSLRKGILPP